MDSIYYDVFVEILKNLDFVSIVNFIKTSRKYHDVIRIYLKYRSNRDRIALNEVKLVTPEYYINDCIASDCTSVDHLRIAHITELKNDNVSITAINIEYIYIHDAVTVTLTCQMNNLKVIHVKKAYLIFDEIYNSVTYLALGIRNGDKFGDILKYFPKLKVLRLYNIGTLFNSTEKCISHNIKYVIINGSPTNTFVNKCLIKNILKWCPNLIRIFLIDKYINNFTCVTNNYNIDPLNGKILLRNKFKFPKPKDLFCDSKKYYDLLDII